MEINLGEIEAHAFNILHLLRIDSRNIRIQAGKLLILRWIHHLILAKSTEVDQDSP
jgi:hypothetical protein